MMSKTGNMGCHQKDLSPAHARGILGTGEYMRMGSLGGLSRVVDNNTSLIGGVFGTGSRITLHQKIRADLGSVCPRVRTHARGILGDTVEPSLPKGGPACT